MSLSSIDGMLVTYYLLHFAPQYLGVVSKIWHVLYGHAASESHDFEGISLISGKKGRIII